MSSPRLVTFEDLEKYPQLRNQGVSANQNYNFSHLEQLELQSKESQPKEEVKDVLPFAEGIKPKKVPAKKTSKKK